VTITLLILSLAINVLSLFYARWLINIIRTKEEDVNNLADIVAEYVSHVKAVHEMEMFYGDQTLSSLIEHGKNFVSKIESFDYFVLVDDEIEEEVDETE